MKTGRTLFDLAGELDRQMTAQLPTVQVVSTVASSSVSDTNDPGEFTDFASRNEDRIATETVPMLAPTDLVQLPKGQAFALLHGGQLHKIRMPLPSAAHDPLMPAGLAEIGAALKARLEGPWLWPVGTPAILSESDGLVDAGDLGGEGEGDRAQQREL